VSKSATAIAGANIALVKYWGKRDLALNLPDVGSISITLDALQTRTTVVFDEHLEADELRLNGRLATPAAMGRAGAFLDIVRAQARISDRARIISNNNFPTGSGLASSASGFAALGLAASRAAGLVLNERELSILSRRGAGSAARSIFGGFVRWHKGTRPDGADSFAEPICGIDELPLEVHVAVVERGEKPVSSTVGMLDSAAGSCFYPAWVAEQAKDLSAMRAAIAIRDFAHMATIAERSCLKMHAVMLAGQPPLLYWKAETVKLIHAVRALRAAGHPVFFTIDAGPQVKVVCAPEGRRAVIDMLENSAGVVETISSGLGQGARLVDTN